MNFRHKIDYKLVLIVLVNLCLITFYFYQKTDFHGDEIFSFAHANSRQGPYLADGIDSFQEDRYHLLYGHNFTSAFFNDYVTVKSGHGFDYGPIISNLAAGFHPPLYYFILHTVSSFFPETFSKWTGFPINLVAFIFLIFFLDKISRFVFEDKNLCYLCVIFFGFSLAALNMAVFIRSYMLQAMLTTWLIYEHLRFLKNGFLNAGQAVLIFLLSLLCYLTHYYLLIAVFFIAAFTGIILLTRKKIRPAVLYVVLMLASVTVFFWFYSPAAEVLLHSYRGEETADKDWGYYLLYFEPSLTRIANLVITKILPFNSNFSGFWVVIGLILAVSFVKLRQNSAQTNNAFLICLCLYTVPYIVLIAFISPDMADFDDRYFMPVIPALCILIIYAVRSFLLAAGLSAGTALYVLTILILCNTFLTDFYHRSTYAFRTTEQDAALLADMKGKKIIFNGWKIFSIINLVNDFRNVNSVKITDYDQKEEFIAALKPAREDYAIIANSSSTRSMKLNPPPALPIDIQAASHLQYLKTFRRGTYFYDLYKIRHQPD